MGIHGQSKGSFKRIPRELKNVLFDDIADGQLI